MKDIRDYILEYEQDAALGIYDPSLRTPISKWSFIDVVAPIVLGIIGFKYGVKTKSPALKGIIGVFTGSVINALISLFHDPKKVRELSLAYGHASGNKRKQTAIKKELEKHLAKMPYKKQLKLKRLISPALKRKKKNVSESYLIEKNAITKSKFYRENKELMKWLLTNLGAEFLLLLIAYFRGGHEFDANFNAGGHWRGRSRNQGSSNADYRAKQDAKYAHMGDSDKTLHKRLDKMIENYNHQAGRTQGEKDALKSIITKLGKKAGREKEIAKMFK
jgi:hypothetical protein